MDTACSLSSPFLVVSRSRALKCPINNSITINIYIGRNICKAIRGSSEEELYHHQQQQQQQEFRPSIPFDFSSFRDIPPSVGFQGPRRTTFNARRRILQNQRVPDIHPEINGQATKIEKLWKDWKTAYRDSYSRGLEYLAPQVIDPEDDFIIENDGLWIEKKYPDIKTKSTIITREGEIL